jgi:hypothetical protein
MVVYRADSRASSTVGSSARPTTTVTTAQPTRAVGNTHLPVTAGNPEDLTAVFRQIAPVDTTAGLTTTVGVQNIQKDESQKASPFMKLPAELRCFIYEQVFLEIVRGVEAIAWLTRKSARPGYGFIGIRGTISALPHTCRIVRTESTPIYAKLIRNILDERNYEITHPTYATYIGDHGYRRAEDPSQYDIVYCNLLAASHITKIVLHLSDNVERELSKLRHSKIMSMTLELCIGAQNRIQDGTGVRAAFKAEVRAQCGAEITDGSVKYMIKRLIKDRNKIVAALEVVRKAKTNSRSSDFLAVGLRRVSLL